MSRPLRVNFPGAFYHVTSRGNEKKPIYKSKRDRQKYLEYLESASARYNVVIHAYCLMNNHYHLLIETPSGNLPQIMRHINGAYTTYFNFKRGRTGHLFQGRYKAILVEMDEYAKELSRYIHLNPVRANIFETPDEFEWSSYNFYIGRKKSPAWLCRDFILGYFGKKIKEAQQNYKQFVTSLLNEEYDSPLKEVTGSLLLGSEEFVKTVKTRYLSDRQPERDLPAIRQLIQRITLPQIMEVVDSITGDKFLQNRNLKIYLCRKHTGEKLKTIGEYFGIGDSAVSQSSKRFEDKIKKDKRLKKVVEKIERKLIM